MRVKNKKTGEIATLIVDGAYDFVANFAVEDDDRNRLGEYDSLAKLNSEWGDVPEEPKEYWFVGEDGNPHIVPSEHYIFIERIKEIGNYFASEEEAKKAVEKLKAFKRLKDKGFRFTGWYCSGDATNTIRIYAEFPDAELGAIAGRDLDICFGEEQ